MGRRGRGKLTASGGVFFVTTTFVDFKPLLLNDSYYRLIIDSLDFMQRRGDFTLIAYSIMPTHLHLVLQISGEKNISEIMRDFKKYTSFRIRKRLEDDGHHRMVESLRLPRGNRQVFKVWMDRFDDLLITNEETLRTKVEYIHQNPVRAGLVERDIDWPYSSARNYHLNDHSLVEVKWVL
ncbi:MAG: transposase [Anaerolineae bacterium]